MYREKNSSSEKLIHSSLPGQKRVRGRPGGQQGNLERRAVELGKRGEQKKIDPGVCGCSMGNRGVVDVWEK